MTIWRRAAHPDRSRVIDRPDSPAWGHGGWFPGYRSRVLFFPERELAVAVPVNRDGDTDTREHATALAEALVGGG